jgi:hypothetical protein
VAHTDDGPVRGNLIGASIEFRHGYVDGLRGVAGVPLVRLSNVEQKGVLIQQFDGLSGRHLVDEITVHVVEVSRLRAPLSDYRSSYWARRLIRRKVARLDYAEADRGLSIRSR